MDFFEAVQRRRSIRQFTTEVVPDEVIEKALDAAILAPNSSNSQTWNFYWVQTPEKKAKLVKYCLNQSAARKASQLIVVTADPSLWRRSRPHLEKWVRDANAPNLVVEYYRRVLPYVYRWGFLNSLAPFKFLFSLVIGMFRPIMRGPCSRRDIQEVALKSAAFAAENFVLAISAQGYSSCMMEGFDEWRVCRLLNLGWAERVAMVIGVGREAERGTWGPRFRLPKSEVVKKI
jgi:nitroreductase